MNIATLLRETYKPPGETDKYGLIQALRFIAALAVVVCHATFYAQERLVDGVFRYNAGSSGVGLFFVISGFVMIIASEKLLNTVDGWKQFAARRIVRIVPLYWFATSIKLFALLFTANLVLHAEVDWIYILKSYFFVPAVNVDDHIKPLLGVGWTLLFEMFFYAVFAMCLFLRIDAVKFCAGLFGVLALASIFKTDSWPTALYFYSDPIVLDFLWGMLAAKLIQQRIYMPKTVAMVAVALSLVYLFMLWRILDWPGGKMLCGIASLLLVYGCASLERQINIRVPQVLIFWGAASYAIYLFHPLASPAAPEVLKRIGLISPSLSVLLSVLIAIVVGSIVYALMENPTTMALNKRVKSYFSRTRGGSGMEANSAA